MTTPVILCILDGWGIGKEGPYNAITSACPETFNFLMQNFPSTLLHASGSHVGLPEGQMGNSEVGHTAIGSGRVIMQDLPRINAGLTDALHQNNCLRSPRAFSSRDDRSNTYHIIGLASDGGVHSHIDHLITVAKHLTSNNVHTHLHLITDGRDTSPRSGITFIEQLEELESKEPLLNISTISGRYYAMDRDKRLERTKEAFNTIMYGDSPTLSSPSEVILESYKQDVTDEFIKPQSLFGYHGIQDGDSIIFTNFRADRMIQLCEAICNEQKHSHIITMTPYSSHLSQITTPLFEQIAISNTLSDVLHQHNLSQLKVAETEKYAHITYFFNGGKETIYTNEKRMLIPSLKVATYDLQPEMSASDITQTVIKELKDKRYDFTLINYANPDMVGHTGNFNATVKAAKAVDESLRTLYHSLVIKMGYTLLVTADHGNAECMFDCKQNSPQTAHTTNPVPFIIVNNKLKGTKAGIKPGSLADVAPTVLTLLKCPTPDEMTGINLLNRELTHVHT